MNFPGIDNSSEFYTHHYLAAVLSRDLKGVFDDWGDDDALDANNRADKKPHEKLRALAQDFFKFRADLESTDDPARRHDLHRQFLAAFLYALGYDPTPRPFALSAPTQSSDLDAHLDVLAHVHRADGAPVLWALQVTAPTHELSGEDPLNLELLGPTVEELVGKHIFQLDEPPRFLLLCGESQILLIDRSKWREKRLLRFDLTEILGRKDTETLKIMAALLERTQIWSDDDQSLLDALDESSHKHAFSVSEDLKYALREAIEILGNEAIYYKRHVSHEKLFSLNDKELANQLSRECLRFMYRVLFLFYIEARPELGYAPMGNDAYRMGYSLESLRELELVELTTSESLHGYYLHESLQLLFAMIHEGVQAQSQHELSLDAPSSKSTASTANPVHGLFELSPLRSHLFDPAQTPILSSVKLRNEQVQQIIELMSLSRADGPKSRGKRHRRGRISYAQLGINQLGAVYEALLSYRGFFATDDLFEVKRKKDDYDPLHTAYFVPRDELSKYDDKEIVKDPNGGSLVSHPKGAFIYRLAGRDREKSASYYTPEVLTRCLVKYALKELLDGTQTADEILHLTVCEPAMGSAAFLNEAVNQLAEAYLQKKQAETGLEIPHDDYLVEKQRVKMFIADRNVYGVDLNPIAVELAEVSLWLNTIHKGGFVPWFGTQLRCGNSLIGARRQFFTHRQLDAGPKSKTTRWLKEPPITGEREPGSVYHFFLGHPAMADYNDPIIRGKSGKNPIPGLAEDAYNHFKSWRNAFCAPLDDYEIDSMAELSDAVDRLWTRHVESLAKITDRTTDPLDIWPHTTVDPHTPSTTAHKDKILAQELYSLDTRAASPYRRLKLVMDYWCALWFWPNDAHELIPDRDEYLWDLSLLLNVDVYQAPPPAQGDLLFPETRPLEESQRLANELGIVDIDKLLARGDDTARRLQVVQDLAKRHRFHHWELEFADIFHDRGGFDLILGNPPWLKVEWDESGVLGDHDPYFVIKKLSAAKTRTLREETIDRLNLRDEFLTAYEEATGTQNFLNAFVNYPELKGIQTNLYKCFIPQGWHVGNQNAVVGYLHPEGIYDDPKGGEFREGVYRRLRYHFQFVNEKTLFSEVHHHTRFSINIYRSAEHTAQFIHIANLFLPQTVDTSINHHGQGPVPGIKDDDNKWNTRGHAERVIHVTRQELALFARLYDDEGTPPLQARLPALHSTQLIDVLQKFANQPHRLSDLQGEYYATVMFDETNAVKKDHTIRRETRFPSKPDEWILSGPHFFVANPFNKTPREECNHNQAYDPLDLTDLPDDYLPRTNYVPDCPPDEYLRRTPRVPWGTEKPVTEFYRAVSRTMLSQSGERTLITTITPPQTGHLDLGFSLTFKDIKRFTPFITALFSSVPYDFFVKSTGKGHFRQDIANQMKIPTKPESLIGRSLIIRVLLLNTLTTHYADLWQECYDPAFNDDRWAKDDPRLDNAHFTNLTPHWTRHVALRTDFARRQALVEIDVLAAMALGLTLEELQTIYRVQFPVMRMYEGDTWYDQNGRIVFTNSRGLVGVGLPRSKSASWPDGPYWSDVEGMTEGTVTQTVTDDTLPGGPRQKVIEYVAPFTKCDREADYAEVWRVFENRFARLTRSLHHHQEATP